MDALWLSKSQLLLMLSEVWAFQKKLQVCVCLPFLKVIVDMCQLQNQLKENTSKIQSILCVLTKQHKCSVENESIWFVF